MKMNDFIDKLATIITKILGENKYKLETENTLMYLLEGDGVNFHFHFQAFLVYIRHFLSKISIPTPGFKSF